MKYGRLQPRHICAAFILLVAAASAVPALARLPFARPDRAKNPPLNMTCSDAGCHTPAVCADPAGRVEVLGVPECYEPGREYTLRVKVTDSDPNKRRWGFQVGVQYDAGADDASNLTAGTLANAANQPTRKVTSTDGLRDFITHDSEYQMGTPQAADGTYPAQAGGAEWSFKWTAPNASDFGVCFYVAGVSANNLDNRTGDCTYTNKYCIPKCAPTSTVPRSWGSVKDQFLR